MQKLYPFKFLDSYGAHDRAIFFGRDSEIQQVYEMIFQTDLLLVYGASGTGKTSLIQCGLASRFETHDWLPIAVRRASNLNISFEKALLQAGGTEENENWDFEESSKTKILSPLARRLKAIYLKHFKPIYLIFDQFEELYILGSKEEQDQFMETVKEILTVDQPVKILFSIREEYLGHLYEFEKAVPDLMRKKLRVEPMNLDKIGSVLKGIQGLKNSQISLEKGREQELTERIFEKIKDKDKSRTIQLPYLQVFLDKLYLRITQDETRQTDAVFTLAELDKIGDIGDVLRDFVEEQALKIAQELGESPETIWKILSPFVTLDGTKEPLNMDQLAQKLADLDRNLLRNAVKTFTDKRILRFLEHNALYEIAHDSLAKQIASKRTDEEIAILEVQRLIHSQTAAKKEAREYFTEKQLDFIEPYLPKLALNEAEREWLTASKANLEKRKLAEKEKQEKELREAHEQMEKEVRLRSEAEREKEKAKRNARISIYVAVFAFVLSILAGVFYFEAENEKKIAQELLVENRLKDSLNRLEKYSRLVAEGKNLEMKKEFGQAKERYIVAKEFTNDSLGIWQMIMSCEFEDYAKLADKHLQGGHYHEAIQTYEMMSTLGVKTAILRDRLHRLRNSLNFKAQEKGFLGDVFGSFDMRQKSKFQANEQVLKEYVAQIDKILAQLPAEKQ